ncbi:unnamed protein product [Linum trigynum]|uniref:Nudix hydrolase domain-containing protein n=1 Tax=Linum trigynum TaxID=586398 RepID=A0AAV2FPR8_9ROSI
MHSNSRHSDHRHHGGDREVRVWIFAEKDEELLLQSHRRPGHWDASAVAASISDYESSLQAARRLVQSELGINLPTDAFELVSSSPLKQPQGGESENVLNNDVYLVTTLEPIPLQAFTLQVKKGPGSVKYMTYNEYKNLVGQNDPAYVQPPDIASEYAKLFAILTKRYQEDRDRCSTLHKQLQRYAPVSLTAQLSGLSDGDKEALGFIIKAAKAIDEIFFHQVLDTNALLRDWLQGRAAGDDASQLDHLKWDYYVINKSPWSSLDENEAFLTTKDSAIKLATAATKPVEGWKGLEYRVALSSNKPPGANFYPLDMSKKEFESWKSRLPESQQKEAQGFFTVIRRQSETNPDLYIVPYSQQYDSSLTKAAEFLHKAGDLATTPSLKKLLHTKADAFLSNDYYESDIAWMDLDSKIDVTIGPYETYEDSLFGYKATFESFIGIRDDEATGRIKMFGENMLKLEQNLPMDDQYKSTNVNVSPIRVIQLIYNSGDVDGPQIAAFNLPNDERIVNDRGTSMVMIKNIQEAKFEKILKPIADICINNEQKELVDFDSFFTHITCHECIHGIGPHTITLPDGSTSTVRQELQEFHTVLEEAKADIVGLWALRFFISQGLLPKSMLETMYVSFLATCFRSVRYGLQDAHGKGQAVQFNWLFEKQAIVLHSDDETFSVDFTKVEEAVESLSKEILTIQAKGNKQGAIALLQKYGQITKPLQLGLDKLEKIQVSVDIALSFPIADETLKN